MTVLVVYASAHGSTRSIAERIAGVLTERGEKVELRSVHEVEDVAGFDAFVVGSAIHNQAWLIEATDFATANRDVLASHPVWLFSVGMPAALRGPWRRFVAKEEATVAARLREQIRPRGHRLFSGVVRREHISPTGRLLFAAMGCRYGDYRDWAEIEDWAAGIAAEPAPAPAPPRSGT